MNRSIRNTLALCALLGSAFGVASTAGAQNAAAPAEPTLAAPVGMAEPAADAATKAMPKPRHKMAKPKAARKAVVVITVSNKRAVALTELDATPAGGVESAKILGNLAPGKKASAKVEHDKDCTFDLHGIYEDGATTDMPGIDLCKDKTVNLVE